MNYDDRQINSIKSDKLLGLVKHLNNIKMPIKREKFYLKYVLIISGMVNDSFI